jgi:hypothetical protein
VRPESAWWQKAIVESLVYITVCHLTAREIFAQRSDGICFVG